MRRSFAFISYRRTDSSAASRWLANSIGRTFGSQSVFVDTEAIRMSDDWAQRIDEALALSTLLIPVIGSRWLSTADADHRRRIDDSNDWVHKEILHALLQKKQVLPILLSRTPMPAASALPNAISTLARYQGFELRDERWESDLSTLLSEMERFGFTRATAAKIRYPSPLVSLSELTPQELEEGLAKLPGWTIVTTEGSSSIVEQRIELSRTFEFASFEDAIRFMGDAAPRIAEMQHHPRWENLWRSVSIYLSTWDIGHKPSQLDITLASHLEDLRRRFPDPRRKTT